MALFELEQHYENEQPEYHAPTFRECAEEDIDLAFFEANEHAALWKVNGKETLVIFESDDLRDRSAHWEAGAKQNFDTALYVRNTVLYIRVKDYGPNPQNGKYLIMENEKGRKRKYSITKCEEEDGIYRMVLERVKSP